jgi:P27 family predicted phage terminase small subunit
VSAKYWRDVTEELLAIGLLSPLDYGALSLMCVTFGQAVDSHVSLKNLANLDPIAKGLVLDTQNGNTVVNPLVGINQRAIGNFLRIATEFGMTPSARSRIEAHNLAGSATPAQDEDDDISEFLKRA